jgi:hypothetical protein
MPMGENFTSLVTSCNTLWPKCASGPCKSVSFVLPQNPDPGHRGKRSQLARPPAAATPRPTPAPGSASIQVTGEQTDHRRGGEANCRLHRLLPSASDSPIPSSHWKFSLMTQLAFCSIIYLLCADEGIIQFFIQSLNVKKLFRIRPKYFKYILIGITPLMHTVEVRIRINTD